MKEKQFVRILINYRRFQKVRPVYKMSTRELNFFMARVADQAERHEDVIKILKDLAEKDPKLNGDERNLLSVAYKALTGSRRTALRTVNAFLDEDSIKTNEDRKKALEKLRDTLTKELDDYCNDLIKLVTDKEKGLINADPDPSTKVFYYKLAADYYRYSVEFKEGADRDKGAEEAKKAYENAMELAKDKLQKANPQYLGLALNYSVFLYEIAGKKKEAITLADDTFQGAVDFLDELSEEEYSEATLVLQLLKDNVSLWNEEQQQ